MHKTPMQIHSFIKLAAVVLLCFAVILTSGCSFNLSADVLLTPPKLTDEQTEIYNALAASAGAVDLRYPRTGDYRSAFVIHNIDDEYSDEAIVFYESKAAANANVLTDKSVGNLRIGFLDKDENGDWHTLYEMPADGTEIDSVSFSRLGGNKELLLVSSTVLNSSEKIVSVIDYQNGVASSLSRISCSAFLLNGFTSQSEELLCFSRDKASKAAQFSVYGCDEENKFGQRYNTVSLGHEISEYEKITTGSCLLLNNPSACIAVDYLQAENEHGTDVIYFNGKNLSVLDLSAQNFKGNNYLRRTNSYTPNIYSTDINGDGIMDVPVTSAMPGYENLTIPEQINACVWYAQKTSGAELTAYTFIDPAKNYMVVFPGRWVGMVTATVSLSDSAVTFWKAEEKGELKSPLLNIRVVKKGGDVSSGSSKTAERDGYKLFYEDGEKIIYIKSIMYADLSLTEDEAEAAIKIRPEDFLR